MKNKKLILIALALVVVVGAMLGVYMATRPEMVDGVKEFTVTVVHSDGSTEVFGCNTDQSNLADALLAEGLIQGDAGEYGLYINTVNGITADWDKDQTYWAFYINGEYAMTGVDATEIEEGATYGLTLTKG